MFKIENEITKVSKYKTFKNKTKQKTRQTAERTKWEFTIANPIVKKKTQKIHQLLKGQVKNRLDKAQKNVVGWWKCSGVRL